MTPNQLFGEKNEITVKRENGSREISEIMKGKLNGCINQDCMGEGTD